MKFFFNIYGFINRGTHRFCVPPVRLSALTGLSLLVRLFKAVGLLTFSSFFMQACVREEMDECIQYELTVNAVDPQGVDVTSSGAVTAVDIYLFDEDGFVRIIPRGTSSDFVLGTEKSKALTLVAWGNLKGDSIKLPDLSVGTSLADAKVELLQSVGGYNLPVSDLFYSRQEINSAVTRGMQNDTVKLVMERLVSGLSVRVNHPAERFGDTSNMHIIVRGTGTSLNFFGKPSDDEAGYDPVMKQVAGEDEWMAPLFRVFPTSENGQIYIDLYRGNTLLFTITTDDNGNILRALSGKETYITVDFRYASLHVSVSVKPWDDAYQDIQL